MACEQRDRIVEECPTWCNSQEFIGKQKNSLKSSAGEMVAEEQNRGKSCSKKAEEKKMLKKVFKAILLYASACSKLSAAENFANFFPAIFHTDCN